ncbi:MAG: hypothetical protein V1793_03335 [Pseudomonadota bacterium]
MKTIQPIEPGQEWTVELFQPEDAPGVTSLFRDVYGDGYPVRTYLDEDLLIRENTAGRVISSVARTTRGDIVGHNALFNSAPYPKTFESGAGLVHRDYRGGHGIFTRMVSHGLDMGRQSGVEQAFGEPVCNHPFSQRLCHSQGFVTRAVEVNLMPAAAYTREASAAGRVTTLLDFCTLIPKPCDVYVPKAYEALFPVFYETMDDQRRFLPSEHPLPSGVNTRLSTQTFSFAQVARVAVTEPGHDFSQAIRAEEERLLTNGIRVIQAWLPTGLSWVGQAVDILRARGYFFGGVLPRWFDTDGLLMEKVLDVPDWQSMLVHFDRGRELAALVRTDWERTCQIPGHDREPLPKDPDRSGGLSTGEAS